MSNVYKVLRTDDEFLTAALSESKVSIIEDRGDLSGCTIVYGGPVRKWSPISVKVDEAYYMRSEFEFKIVLA